MGVTTRTCTFTSQLSLPLPRIHVLRSAKLCRAVEEENALNQHAVAVLKSVCKDGGVVGYVHVELFSKKLSR